MCHRVSHFGNFNQMRQPEFMQRGGQTRGFGAYMNPRMQGNGSGGHAAHRHHHHHHHHHHHQAANGQGNAGWGNNGYRQLQINYPHAGQGGFAQQNNAWGNFAGNNGFAAGGFAGNGFAMGGFANNNGFAMGGFAGNNGFGAMQAGGFGRPMMPTMGNGFGQMPGMGGGYYCGNGMGAGRPGMGGIPAGWARIGGGMNAAGQTVNVFVQQNGRPGMNQNANVFVQQNGGMNGLNRPHMGGWQAMPREMPKIDTKGAWLAQHGKYDHGADGTYTIRGGDYNGYTARYTGKDGVFNIFKNGHFCGQWTSPTKIDKIASPVALDLDGDGRISTTGASTARDRADPNAIGQTIAFDLNGDGVKEQVEWMNGNDGLVVDASMIGADGSIDGRALMGDQGGRFTDGYAKMAGYDQNGDGQLTGQELGNLGVWVDNGNGIVEQGEIRSLADVGVTSLSTQRNDVVNNNGETLMRSTADVNGQQMMTEDVWFRQA